MPLPEPLKPLIQTRRFWTDFFRITHQDIDTDTYNELQDCTIDFLLGDTGHGLSISLQSYISEISLSFISSSPKTKKLVIAYDDEAHWFPHALRWEEVNLICDAVSSVDPELKESGVLLPFLSRFAPICQGDDVDWIVGIMGAALAKLDVFSEKEIRDILEKYDARDAGFRWRYDDVVSGWCLEKHDDGTSARRGLYSLRTVSDGFPFKTWPLIIAGAESMVAAGGAAPRPEQSALRKFKPRRKYDFDLSIGLQDRKLPLSSRVDLFVSEFLDRILADFDIGRAYMGGGTSRTLPSGETIKVEFRIAMKIHGDLDFGMNVVKDILRWAGMPEKITWVDCDFHNTPFSIGEKPVGKPREVRMQLGRIGTLYRYDGKPLEVASLPRSCRTLLKAAIDNSHGEGPDEDEWYTVSMADGGLLKASFNKIESDAEQDLDTIVIRNPSLETAQFLYSLMMEGGLVLFPLFVAASESVTEPYRDRECPNVHVVSSAAELHVILSEGAYNWWSKTENEDVEVPI